MDATDLFKLLLAPDRLAVVGAIATRARDIDQIAAHTEVDRRTVLETVAALVDGGAVVEDEAGRYQLDRTVLVDLAQRLPQPLPPDRAIFHGMTAEEREILGRFFRGEELVEIPSSRSKRLVVLERLGLEFEPGRRYDEHEVNEILARFHADHASLRRYLVDEGLLSRARSEREDGTVTVEYWRSGGRVLTGERRHDAKHDPDDDRGDQP